MADRHAAPPSYFEPFATVSADVIRFTDNVLTRAYRGGTARPGRQTMNEGRTQTEARAPDPLLQVRDRVRGAEWGTSYIHFDVLDADGIVVGVVTRQWPAMIGIRLNWRRATLVLVPVERLRIDAARAEIRVPYRWGQSLTAGSGGHGRLVA